MSTSRGRPLRRTGSSPERAFTCDNAGLGNAHDDSSLTSDALGRDASNGISMAINSIYSVFAEVGGHWRSVRTIHSLLPHPQVIEASSM